MTRYTFRRVPLVAALNLLVPLSMQAQSSNALIEGQVSDNSGAAIGQATVLLISKDTGVSRDFKTSNDGLYSFRDVSPGNYELKVTATGFGDYSQEGILVRIGYPIRQDVVLQVGQTKTAVNVTADASALNFDNAEIRGSIDPQIIQQVPLLVSGSIRSAANFASLLPGVARGTSDVSGAHVNGGQSQTGVVILDGVSLFNSSGTQGLTGAVLDFPQSPDLISEFQVLTANYDVRYDSAAGVTIENVRSGTDVFHGTAYEYLRNTSLNATQWGASDKSKDIENDFGGNFGGPLKLPFWKHRDHKTFFFTNFEGFTIRGGLTRQTLSLPSKQEQMGDFSDWKDTSGNLIPIYDPATTRPNPAFDAAQPVGPNNLPYLRNQFMGCNGNAPNVICPYDPRLQNSLAQQWFKYLPTPTSPGPLNNYLAPATPSFLGSDAYTGTGKIDEYIGSKDHISGMFFYKSLPETTFTTLPVTISNSGTSYKRTSVLRISWDHTFNPSIVNHLGFGFQDDIFYGGGIDGNSAGDLPQIPGVASHAYPPQILFGGNPANLGNFTGYGTGQGNPQIQPWLAPAYLVNDVLSWSKGKHLISVGADLRFARNSPTFLTNQSGQFTFSPTETGLLGVNSGNPIASFLLGLVDSASATFYTTTVIDAHTSAYAAFVGDTWRVTPKLTVTPGIRWELAPPPYEANNHFSWFDPTKPNPGAGGLSGAMEFASDNDRYPENVWYRGVAPRIGLAYSWTPNTVVRSGYGIFFDIANMPGYDGGITQDGYNTYATFGSSLGGLQAAFNLADGLPQNFPQPPQLIPTFDNGANTPIYRPKDANRLPYAQQWNFTVEHQFTPRDYLSLSYLGTKGTHLQSQVDPINALNPKYLSMGASLYDVFQPGQTVLDGVPAPFPGFATTMTGCSPSVAQALLPYPQYCNAILGRNEHQGNSTYNSLQLKAEHRFTNGLWGLVTYTYSKLLTDADANENIYGAPQVSPYDPSRRKALALEDVPQVFNLAFNYELPFGKGKKWVSGGGFGNAIVGGWTLNGVFRAQSGIPFQITSSNCNVPGQLRAVCFPGTLYGTDPYALSLGSIDVSKPLLNINAFESVNSFNFYTGNGSRVQSFRQPGYADIDVGLQKNFRLTERFRFQLRGDVFNLLNAHYFNQVGVGVQGIGIGGSAFNTDIASGQFGMWNGTVTAPRNIQVSGRISF